MKTLTLSYLRLPNKITRFPVVVLYENSEYVVFINLLNPSKPLIINESILLDKNHFGIWFCPTKNFYDFGAIYNREKHFKGYYCDMCTPIRKVSLGYEMIDFFLDLWIFPDGRYYILDQDEFNDAIEQGLMDQKQIFEVKAELTRLVDNVKSKRFPSLKVKNLLRLPKNIDKIVYTLEKLSKELAS